MKMEKPEIEFIELEEADIIVTSPGGVGSCKKASDENCDEGADWL